MLETRLEFRAGTYSSALGPFLPEGEEVLKDDFFWDGSSELKLEKLEEDRSQTTLNSWIFNPEFMNVGPFEEF